MKNKTTALLLVLASSALILAGCGKTTASSTGTSSAASSKTTSTPTTSAPASSTSAPASSTSAPASSTSAPASSSSSQEEQKLDIAYADDNFALVSQDDLVAGELSYWAGNDFGLGGTVSAHSKTNGTYSMTFTNGTANWWGIQVFYKLPFADAGDTYHVSMTFTSTVAGKVTFCGDAKDLVVGDNVFSKDLTQGGGKSALVTFQLGADGAAATAWPTAGDISFKLPVVNDTTAGHVYHEVKFMNGETTLKDIQVKEGKKVAAPADPTPATGYVFDGWYDGTTEFDAAAAVSAAATYTAKFIAESEAAKYTVTFMNGTATLGTTQVLKGKKVVVPTLDFGFGKGLLAWYKEATLATAWNLDSDVVTADVTLYAKTRVATPNTWTNDAAVNLLDNVTVGTAGECVLSYHGWGATAYFVQLNFGPIPVGVANTNYKISITYKINIEGADVKISDDGHNYAVIGDAVTMTSTTDYVTKDFPFAGGVLSDTAKLTFELGAIAVNADYVLSIQDVTLSTVA